MKQYRPRRPARPRRRKSRAFHFSKKTLLVICVAAAAILITIFAVNAGGSSREIDPNDTFADNVTVQGVSIGGMTASEARVALNPTIKEMMAEAVIEISVPNPDADAEEDGEDKNTDVQEDEATQVVKYSATQAGVSVDVDSALQQAMDYSVNDAPRKASEAPVQDFTMLYVLDETTLADSLDQDADQWTLPAQDAKYVLKTEKDEEDLTTSAEPVKQEGIAGSRVDVAALTEKVKEMVSSQSFGLIEAPVTEVPPSVTADQLPEIEVIGSYSTGFSSSSDSRMYNIWKISSILNGRSIAPGDKMSVNNVVGPRTEEGGWALAAGIENGVYTDQAGGGICQVSSTLYIASLKAELKIVDRTHHTIPSTYVPLGLDATISTDAPDLELENNTEYPVLIGINCDVPDRTVEVKLYGYNPRDYTLRFESVIMQTNPAPADEYTANPEVPVNQVVQVMPPHDGYVVDVYKIWYDEDGNEYDRKRIYTDTYKALSGKYEYNPTTPPAAVTSPSAAASTPAAATPTPAPTATPVPEVSENPVTDPAETESAAASEESAQ